MAKKKQKRHQQESYLFLLMGLILMGLIIAGYFLFVDKVMPNLSPARPQIDPASGPSAVIAGDYAPGEYLPPGEGQVVTLYFPARGREYLDKELRKIPQQTMVLDQARLLVEELIKGPYKPDCRPSLPEGTQLRALFFNGGTFIVDFSSEIRDAHIGGPVEEALTLYSIVNTLTELDKKAKVQFLVNGQEIATLKGHFSLDEPLTRFEPLTVSVADG